MPIVGFFNKKIRKSVIGRKNTMATLRSALEKGPPVMWMHAASLGEYEQGLPVMKALQQRFPNHQWVVSFFSPSGYEIKKDNAFAKATVYLPIDTPANACEFLEILSPDMALFVKYEFWPNYLNELKRQNVRTFLISGVFRESQPFFRWYGKWMKESLKSFEYFFLQDKASSEALKQLGFTNYAVSGDTRFDRVSHQIEMDNTLDFIETFKQGKLCVVCGSTWSEDEQVLLSFINDASSDIKFIIAPHEIKPDKIADLESRLLVKSTRYSQYTEENLKKAQVLIIDTIGLLAKIYSYADIAYVGGAMGTTGLHNILEPATFGTPIVIGSNFKNFPEAKRLQQLAGLYSVSNQEELNKILTKLTTDINFRNQTGMIAGHFINSNTGATKAVSNYFE
ncbi:3-deoxy-D-manno-octulosonic-acid transferase [Dokdonia sp. Hel_I_53]|nr:3-deoxy-D-manno-octulosonic-acid transferase [Dokdonia sp. Hel_I_53]